MDRYYTILVEALKQLGRDDRATRDAVYRRARDELDRMLDGQDQPIPVTQRIAQKSELEQAIARLEGEIAAARVPQTGDRRPVADRPFAEQAMPPAPQPRAEDAPTLPPPSEPTRPEPDTVIADDRAAFDAKSNETPFPSVDPQVPEPAAARPPSPAVEDQNQDWGTAPPAPDWPSDAALTARARDADRGVETTDPDRRRLPLQLPDFGRLLRRDRQGAGLSEGNTVPAADMRGPVDMPEITDGGQRTPLPAPQGRDVSEILSASGRSRRRLLVAGAAGAVVVVGAAAYWTFVGSGEDPMQALAETVTPLFTGDDPSVLAPVGGETVSTVEGQPVARVVSAATASGADMRAVGVLLDIPGDLRGQVHNRFLRITAIARRAADNGSDAFAIAYSTVSAGASDWKEFDLGDDFRAFEFVYLRSSNPGDPAPDAIIIRADPSGGGGGIDLRFVGIEILA